MKKIFLIFSVFLLVSSSCETDFNVHAPWEEITVVYGLLNQNLDRQYIKINKAYLGAGDAFQMAQISDSINFEPENMEVRLWKLQGQDTVDFINLDTTLIIKDPLDVNGDLGIFSIENNIIYTTLEKDSDFVEVGKRYALTIENKESGNFVSANTNLVSGPAQTLDFFKNLIPTDPLGFYNPTLLGSERFTFENIRWYKVNYGAIYQLEVRFNYKENNIEKFLSWRQPLLAPGSSSSMSTKLWGDNFFNFLSNNLENNSSFIREFISLDLIMTIGTSDLVTYMSMNEPYEGLVQERPVYTNINNGFGLFSSRLTYVVTGISLTAETQIYLKEDLQRNFQ